MKDETGMEWMDIASRINQGLRDVSLWKGGLRVSEKPALAAWFDDKSFDKRTTENPK
jgi:hypothetical protein